MFLSIYFVVVQLPTVTLQLFIVLLTSHYTMVTNDYHMDFFSGQSIDCAQLIERVVQNLTSRLNRIDAKESSQQTSEAQVLDNRAESLTQLPTIFMITPTYYRWTQKADLVRLCQTLMHVQNLHWIVVEDEVKNTELVTNFLERCKVSSTHLSVKSAHKLPAKAKKHSRHRLRRIKIKAKPKTTAKKKVKGKGKTKVPRKSRGVDQRNFALQWLRDNYSVGDVSGVVYFGDDDNTYDIQIFEEVSTTILLEYTHSLTSTFSDAIHYQSFSVASWYSWRSSV